MVTACVLFKHIFDSVEMVTDYIARNINLEIDVVSRLRLEVYLAYESRKIGTRTG